MINVRLGYGCGLKVTLLTPAGSVCDLRKVVSISAVLRLPSGETMPADDISVDKVTNAVYVRLLENRELTKVGTYGIVFNVKLSDGVMYSTPMLDIVKVSETAEDGYQEITTTRYIVVTDLPENAERTGASPKISDHNTWLVYNDATKAYEDSGIIVTADDFYTKAETDKKVAELELKNIYINGFGSNSNNVTGDVEIGQYYYNTVRNCIVKRTGEYSWEDIPLSNNTSYYHKGDLYIFDGEKLIKSTEKVDIRLAAEEWKSTILFSDLDKIQLEVGTILVDNGNAGDMSTRFRTKDFIVAPFSIDMSFDYLLNYLYKYDTNGLYIGWENLNSATELEVNNSSYLYKVSFKRNDGADINSDDLKNSLTYRGKVGLLEKEVLNTKDILNSVTEDVYVPMPLYLEMKDSYLNKRGEVISAETGNFSIRIYDCKGISKIKLEGTGGGSAYRYAFYYSEINPENVIIVGPQMSGEQYSEILEVPNNAELIAVSYRSSWEQSIFSVKKQVKGTANLKSLKILCFGNSFTLGSMGYAPFLLKDHFKEEIELTVGIAFISGGTLGPTWEGVENHLQKITEDTSYTYFKYVSDSTGWIRQSAKPSEILADEDWDVITFQQGSNNSPDYTTYQPYLNQCIDLISQKVSNPVKIAWLIPHADTKVFTQGKEQDILDSAERVMDETITEVLIPFGTAIANARTTSLKEIGDAGNLLYEGKHLQNGLPMLVANYCSMIVLLNLLGMNQKSIVGINSIEVNDAWVSAHNIPNASAVGNCVGVTSENCRIAEKCAIMAVKKPYTIMNL